MNALELPEPWRARALIVSGDPPESWFTDDELRTAASFVLPKRAEEWMRSRGAVKQLALRKAICSEPRDCVIGPDRRLVIAGSVTSWWVSLSHSRGYAAGAIDIRPIGVDAERVRDISESVAHLFLADEEEGAMRSCGKAHRLLHFWAAKEAVWKQLGGATDTLKRVPLRLEAETGEGLRFDKVETRAIGEIVAALTRPTF